MKTKPYMVRSDHLLSCCMWFTSIKVKTETKRDDSVELSFFLFF
jgi:hypothetical protein